MGVISSDTDGLPFFYQKSPREKARVRRKGVKEEKSVVTAERIEMAIFVIRGHKVMLSNHLADLYGVAPKILVQAVKRNRERFPEDFIFQLSAREFENLKS